MEHSSKCGVGGGGGGDKGTLSWAGITSSLSPPSPQLLQARKHSHLFPSLGQDLGRGTSISLLLLILLQLGDPPWFISKWVNLNIYGSCHNWLLTHLATCHIVWCVLQCFQSKLDSHPRINYVSSIQSTLTVESP